MGKAYQRELKQIPATISWALKQDISDLRHTLLQEFAGCNLLAVGSGGSLVAASFATLLHESFTGRLAKPATPLEAMTRPITRDTATLLLSAGGANPDIRQAAKILPTLGYETISALCTRMGSPLGLILKDHGGSMHEFPLPSGRDGFLATNSLIATLVLLYRAMSPTASTYGQEPCSADYQGLYRRDSKQPCPVGRLSYLPKVGRCPPPWTSRPDFQKPPWPT